MKFHQILITIAGSTVLCMYYSFLKSFEDFIQDTLDFE